MMSAQGRELTLTCVGQSSAAEHYPTARQPHTRAGNLTHLLTTLLAGRQSEVSEYSPHSDMPTEAACKHTLPPGAGEI